MLVPNIIYKEKVMKKILAVLAAVMCLNSVAHAEEYKNFIKFDYADDLWDNGGHWQGIHTVIGHSFNNNVAVDFKQESMFSSTSANMTRDEVGAVLSYGMFSLRTGLGEKTKSGVSNSYYTVEPSVKYKINDDWSVKATYRYRDAIRESIKDNTDTWRLGLQYEINKSTYATASYGRITGDQNFDSYSMGVGFRF